MKYIITESQYKLISEKVERTWRDKEYEPQYPKLSKKLIPIISNMIESYNENDRKQLTLFDSSQNIIMTFIPYRVNKEYINTGGIYYNRNLDNLFESFLPHPQWLVHGKYIIQDVFNEYFPELDVKEITSTRFT